MTTTYEILGLDSAVTMNDMDVPGYDPTKFGLVIPVLNADGSREAIFQRSDGDPDHPTSVRVGVYPPKNGGGVTNISVKLQTWSKTVFDDGTEAYDPQTFTFASSGKRQGGVTDVADYRVAVLNLISWVLPLFTGTGYDEAILKLMFGIVDIKTS
jgi:hypothetical protein